jgi:hypothetical protein
MEGGKNMSPGRMPWPGPLSLDCPSCGGKIMLSFKEQSGKEFRCVYCGATLTLPSTSVRLIKLMFIVLVPGLFVWAALAILYNGYSPYRSYAMVQAIFFQGSPIPSVVFWVVIIISVSLVELSVKKARFVLVRSGSGRIKKRDL